MFHWSNAYIGIPYKEKGRTRDGLDCYGLVRLVMYEQFFIELPSYSDVYEPVWNEATAAKLMHYASDEEWELQAKPKAGDCLVLRLSGLPIHCALVLPEKEMLHVYRGIDTCVERYDTHKWRRRIHSVVRHRDIPGARFPAAVSA